MQKDTNQLISDLSQKLDLMIALLLRLVPKGVEGLSLKEQISLLDGFGVRPVEMARITGKSPNHINKELVTIRKQK
jgi:hypothetical protein